MTNEGLIGPSEKFATTPNTFFFMSRICLHDFTLFVFAFSDFGFFTFLLGHHFRHYFHELQIYCNLFWIFSQQGILSFQIYSDFMLQLERKTFPIVKHGPNCWRIFDFYIFYQ